MKTKISINSKSFLRKLFAPAIAFLIANLFLAHKSFGQSSQTFTTPGTTTFTAPAGVTSVIVEVWGGGGAGGGGSTVAAGGGGGGGYKKVIGVTVVPGTNYTIVVGAGGVGAAANGQAGGTSSGTFGVTVVSATGGAGGIGGTPGAGGAGGTGGVGGFTGGTGAPGVNFGHGGGGGSSAGPGTGAGINGNTATSGTGATAVTGGGAGGNGGNGSGNGSSGTSPGGGGGGGINFGSVSGGSGGNGQVKISWVACTPPAAPTVTSPVNYCLNSTASQLTATGSNLLWYTVPSGGTGSSTAPTPPTSSAGSTSYYVSQTVGCEGPRATIVVNVNPLPGASSTKNDVQCFNTATGQIIVTGSGGTGPYTYSIDNGATYLNNGGTFNGLSAGTYQIRVKDSKGCESHAVQ